MECEMKYQRVIKKKLDTHEIVELDKDGIDTVNDKWEKIRDVIRKTAEKVIKISEEERELVQWRMRKNNWRKEQDAAANIDKKYKIQ